MIKKEPRPHQSEAIIKGVEYFASNDRGKMIMACGTGKTLTSLWIAESLNATNIIVALPSLQLQSQTIETWIDEARLFNLKMLAVGSDSSVKFKYGVKATTNSDEIAAFLIDPNPKVLFSTYQSSDVLIKACKETNTVFDFGIIDEAHNTTGSNKKIFSKILKDENGIIVRKRLFMTATPIVFENENAISMNDEKIFGNSFFTITTREAIEQNILTDYKILMIWLNNKDLQKFAVSKGVVSFNGNKTLSKYIIVQEFLEKAVAKYNLKKIVSFHSSKKNSEQFTKLLNSNGLIKGYSLNSNDKINQRIEIVESFKGDEISCICNPRIMIEGFDVPMIDSILFSDIKSSGADTIQSIGRALRKYEGKKISYILFPIVVDDGGVVNASEYAKIINILSNTLVNDVNIYSFFQNQKESFEKGYNRKETEDKAYEDVFIGEINTKIIKKIKKTLSIKVWKNVNNVNGFVSFNEFKTLMIEISKSHNIKTFTAYYEWATGKKDFGIDFPVNFPKAPYNQYKELTTWNEVVSRSQFADYAYFVKEMRTIRDGYNLNSSEQFKKWARGIINIGIKFPNNFPKSPEVVYKEWVGWEHLFEKNNILEFDEFREKLKKVAIINKIDSLERYREWANGKIKLEIDFPINFPKHPIQYYKHRKIKVTSNDLFNIKTFLSYEEFKAKLKKIVIIDNPYKYNSWVYGKINYGVQVPHNFPKRPHTIYKPVFSWDDIFTKIKFVDYETFKSRMMDLSKNYYINSQIKYVRWINGVEDFGIKPQKDLPVAPRDYYKEFTSWHDILIKKCKFLSYDEFKLEIRKLAKTNGINKRGEYEKWKKNEKDFGIEFPKNFPKEPERFYKNTLMWKEIFI